MQNIIPLLFLAGFIWLIYQRAPDDGVFKKAAAALIGVAIAAWEQISGLLSGLIG